MRSTPWFDVARQAEFWATCSLIFSLNAFISALSGFWWLCGLQLATAGMSALAAVVRPFDGGRRTNGDLVESAEEDGGSTDRA